MQNEAGEYVDMYTPRKCSVTNAVIAAKDHASVQLNIGDMICGQNPLSKTNTSFAIDESGRFTGNSKTYALTGFLRKQGEADDSLVQLSLRDGIIPKTYKS